MKQMDAGAGMDEWKWNGMDHPDPTLDRRGGGGGDGLDRHRSTM